MPYDECDYCGEITNVQYVACCQMRLCKECVGDHGCAKVGYKPKTDDEEDEL